MVSKCCRATLCVATSFFCIQLEYDYYICTHCFKPCDTLFMESRKDNND